MNEMQLVNLESEFNQRIKTDVSIFNFICNDVLDGIWYWDLENPEHEWMSRNYWTTLGYNPDEMPHNSDAWQEIIHPDDLVLAREVLQKHFENPSIPYDQTVRMFRKDGEMIWIRCKAQALANEDGKLIRMIGAHFITSTLVFKEDEVVKQLDLSNESIYIALHNDENGTPSAQAIQEILQANKIESNYLAKNSKLSEKLSSFFNSTTYNKQQIGSFVQNIANQVELQNQIKSRDLLLNYFNQNTKDGLLIFNEKLQAIYINEAVNDLAGKKFNQFPISLSQTIEYFHPEDLQELIIIITEAIDQKKEKLKTQHRAFSSQQKIV